MPANRRAALQRFTLERGVIISVSMLDHLGKRVEFLRACAYLNNIRTDGMFLISLAGCLEDASNHKVLRFARCAPLRLIA